MQNIFITGASRGLGLEFTRRFIERGDRVFAACRNPQEAGYLGYLRETTQDRLSIIKLDVSDEGAIFDAYAMVKMQTKQLDLLINNAGIYLGRRGDTPQAHDEQGSDEFGSLNLTDGLNVMRTNAIGPMLIAQQFISLLQAGKNPRVVSVTSGYGSISGNDWGEPYHYSASKAALNQYMRSFAIDAKPLGIASVVISPGWVQTEMGGPRAPLKPLESVDGMIRVINGLTLSQTGLFFDWQGENLDW